MGPNAEPSSYPLPRIVVAGFAVSAIALLTVAVAGPGSRAGFWDFRFGFKLLNWGAYLGIAGIVLSIAGILATRGGGRRQAAMLAVPGIFLGLLAFAVPGNMYRIARQLPMIHDITTDTENPPRFVAVLPLRRDAPNPAEYAGSEIAAKQRAAYPDVRPLMSPLPPPQAFDRALAVARQSGWEIVDRNPAEGRVEATATTRWFGFKDDVVIRIAPAQGGGSRIDVRSVSRLGKSDVGTNARRIRAFLAAFPSSG
jgi:uncharacterized protein (DUF1499 family)